MGKTTYGLMRQKDGQISVEMTKPGGRRCIIPDFRDEAEAKAWIIQTQRSGVPRHTPDVLPTTATGPEVEPSTEAE